MRKASVLSYLVLGYYCVLEISPAVCSMEPEIVSREEWGALPPTGVESMSNPVEYVVIHHSHIPSACFTKNDCMSAMQKMQRYHQLEQAWNDIGYNFGVGGDNRIYVGRGWSSIGAHAVRYNKVSIGICVIGSFIYEAPPEGQLEAVKQLILKGVREGYIREDYKLIGHRQVRKTICPGDAFYKEIKKWPHWVELSTYSTADAAASVGASTSSYQEEIPDPREIPNPDEDYTLRSRRHSVR